MREWAFWVFLVRLSMCFAQILHADVKSSVVAEHARRAHHTVHLNQHNLPSISGLFSAFEESLQDSDARQKAYTTNFVKSTQSQFDGPQPAPQSSKEEVPKNEFSTTAFDNSFLTHSLCEPWNSGKQTDNLEWSESADRLLRIIGNGVVKDGYNMFMAPAQGQGKTTNVSVAVYIESMSSFKAQTMDFEVDMYLALGWYDRRLAHNCTYPILVAHKFIADRIWHPDLYFVNSKFAYLQEVTTPNFMVIVYPDGHIFKSMRVDVTLSCMMDLQRFPMDKQECPLVIQSYAYVENVLNLSWHVDPPSFPIGSNTEIKLNDMVIVGTRFQKCSGPYPMFRGSGNWSCIRALIIMKRLVLFHIIQTYVPTGMLVSISWMSFWLDPRASPARISLTITSLLTLTTMSNGARQDLPQVSYIKALDIWLTFSQALIFLVLLEYSFVSYYITKRCYDCEHRRSLNSPESFFKSIGEDGEAEHEETHIPPIRDPARITRRHKLGNALNHVRSSSTDNGRPTNEFSMNAGLARCMHQTAALMCATPHAGPARKFDACKPCPRCQAYNELTARKIDKYSRSVFPSVFLLFSVTYWLYYSWYTRED